MCKEYHCESAYGDKDGWLPIDGEIDWIGEPLIITDSRGMELLFPTEWIVCPCNPAFHFNDEIQLDNLGSL